MNLQEASRFVATDMRHSLREEIMTSSPLLEQMLTEARAKWTRLPWYKRAYFRTRMWLYHHTPHAHIYFGEHEDA